MESQSLFVRTDRDSFGRKCMLFSQVSMKQLLQQNILLLYGNTTLGLQGNYKNLPQAGISMS